MSRPPIHGANESQSRQEAPSDPRNESAAQKPVDSPLATQLPAWDLLPAHTLLVRRRLAKK